MAKACPVHTKQHEQHLSQAGVRVTPARLKLLDVLEHEKRPLSVREILSGLRHDKADKVTVYRNLESLVGEGLVDQLDFRQGEYLYELKSGRKHHHHLVCTSCGKIADVERCKIVGFGEKEFKQAGFAQVSGHSLEFFGVCNNCKK